MSAMPAVLPMRARAEVIHRTLARRLDEVLPLAMREAGLDAWLLLCQEDDLDPCYKTMIPMDTWCPILQILLFLDRGEAGIQRLAISGTDMCGLHERPIRGQLEEAQWVELLRQLEEADPQRIGLNIGAVAWSAGGLTHNLHQQLVERLPERLRGRLVSAEDAAVRWLSTLTDDDTRIMEHNTHIAKAIIGECFSREVIIPGHTTPTDLEWHFWQRATDLGLGLSFRPYFRAVRSPERTEARAGVEAILPGDLLHCDVGIENMRLLSDHQQWAYVLEPGETEAPAGAREAMRQANRLQDVFLGEFREGLSGNELLGAILTRARAEGIPEPRVYSHSLGYCLHEPGPLIGLPWEQECCVGRGEVKLRAGYAFTMELSVTVPMPEWGGEPFRLSIEEDVLFDGTVCRLMGSRQERFLLV